MREVEGLASGVAHFHVAVLVVSVGGAVRERSDGVLLGCCIYVTFAFMMN
jgi:hypothetical protein